MEIKRVEELMDIEPITSKADLARFLKVSPQSLSNWFSRDNIPEKYAPLLAFHFSKKVGKTITEGFLLGSKKNEYASKPVPVISNASCGNSHINTLQDELYCYINEEKWNKDLYCVIANGDSMYPFIHNGAEVIVDPSIEPKNGDPVYYKIDEESAVKILVIDKDAHIMQLVPINPSESFKTKTIRLDDEETLSRLQLHSVYKINNPDGFNRAAILKMIGR